MDQPVLLTNRLKLRAFTRKDAVSVQKLAGDAAIADTAINIPHPYEDGIAQKWIRTHRKAFKEGQMAVFAVTSKESDIILGACGLTLDLPNSKAELGYWIRKDEWGKGFATEAAAAVIDFGFKYYNLNRIFAHCLKRNSASASVLKKAGMSYEGCLRQSILHKGRFEDLEYYSILRNEFGNSNLLSEQRNSWN